jgi:hypothetical protein
MKHSLLFLGALDYPNVPQAGDAIKNRFIVDLFRRELKGVDYTEAFAKEMPVTGTFAAASVQIA